MCNTEEHAAAAEGLSISRETAHVADGRIIALGLFRGRAYLTACAPADKKQLLFLTFRFLLETEACLRRRLYKDPEKIISPACS